MKNAPKSDSLKYVCYFLKPGLISASVMSLWVKQNLVWNSCEVGRKYI